MSSSLPCDDLGAGAPLLFVHAFPLDARMWQPQRDALAPSHRVLCPDLRGFGRARALPKPTSLDEHADDLAALLDARAIPRATLVGLSMGGYIALAFARRHPTRLAGLVLADTRAAADTTEGKAGRDASIATVTREGVPPLVATLLPKLLGHAAPAAVRDRVRELASEQAPEGVVAALTAMRDRPDATPVLAAIDVPALVIVGRADTLTKPDEAEAMARAIPGAALAVIEGAGHLANLEAPEAFNAALRGFLDRRAPASR